MKNKVILFGLCTLLLVLVIGCSSVKESPGTEESILKPEPEKFIIGKFQEHDIYFNEVNAKFEKLMPGMEGVALTFKGYKVLSPDQLIPINFDMLVTNNVKINEPTQVPSDTIFFSPKQKPDPFIFNIDISDITIKNYPNKIGDQISGNLNVILTFCNEEGGTATPCGWMKGEFTTKVKE